MFLTITNGQSVSSAGHLARSDRRHAVFVASHAARRWFVEYATTSGGAVWHRGDVIVDSVAGPAVGVFTPVTPYVRLAVGAAVAATCSAHILPI
jgi:hypothetical protein